MTQDVLKATLTALAILAGSWLSTGGDEGHSAAPPATSSPVEFIAPAGVAPAIAPSPEQREKIVAEQAGHDRLVFVEPLDNATAQLEWNAGYLDYGGRHLDLFEAKILSCESGDLARPDLWPYPFTATHVNAGGSSTDWGRAQINDLYWADDFEDLFAVPFVPMILDPYLNGAMAAVIEGRHSTGIGAWVCAHILNLHDHFKES